MKAAVVTGFAEPLIIQDRHIPEPGPGQILVKNHLQGHQGRTRDTVERVAVF